MEIKEESRFKRLEIEDNTTAGGKAKPSGKTNVFYLLLSSFNFIYLHSKQSLRNLTKV